jgi:hypothetical protein
MHDSPRRRVGSAHQLAVLVLVSAVSATLESTPSYTRAFTPAAYGRFDDIAAVIDFNGDGRQDLLVGGDRRLAESCLSPSQRPVPAAMRVMASNGNGTFRDATAEVVVREPGTHFNPAWAISTVSDFNGDGRPDVAVFDFGARCNSASGHTFIGLPTGPAAERRGRQVAHLERAG